MRGGAADRALDAQTDLRCLAVSRVRAECKASSRSTRATRCHLQCWQTEWVHYRRSLMRLQPSPKIAASLKWTGTRKRTMLIASIPAVWRRGLANQIETPASKWKRRIQTVQERTFAAALFCPDATQPRVSIRVALIVPFDSSRRQPTATWQHQTFDAAQLYGATRKMTRR